MKAYSTFEFSVITDGIRGAKELRAKAQEADGWLFFEDKDLEDARGVLRTLLGVDELHLGVSNDKSNSTAWRLHLG
jgi:hypothetical protein